MEKRIDHVGGAVVGDVHGCNVGLVAVNPAVSLDDGNASRVVRYTT